MVSALGITSSILAAIAFAISLFSSNLLSTLESNKVPDRHYETDDATIITDKAGNAITFVGQAIVFLAEALVCGTLALVALTLGCVALVRPPRISAAIGVILSLWTFKIIFG